MDGSAGQGDNWLCDGFCRRRRSCLLLAALWGEIAPALAGEPQGRPPPPGFSSISAFHADQGQALPLQVPHRCGARSCKLGRVSRQWVGMQDHGPPGGGVLAPGRGAARVYSARLTRATPAAAGDGNRPAVPPQEKRSIAHPEGDQFRQDAGFAALRVSFSSRFEGDVQLQPGGSTSGQFSTVQSGWPPGGAGLREPAGIRQSHSLRTL